MVTTELTASEVAKRVRPYVEKITLGNISLSVNEAGIYLTHGYWRIPISPSREPKPLYPYIQALATLEEEVEENEDLRVTMTSDDPLEWEEEQDDKEDIDFSLSEQAVKNGYSAAHKKETISVG